MSDGSLPPPVITPGTAPVRRPWWKRLLKVALWTGGIGLVTVLTLAGIAWWLWSSGRAIPLLMRLQARGDRGNPMERPWPDTNATARVAPIVRRDLAALRDNEAFFQPTNVWEARIFLTAKEWQAMQPKPVSARPNFQPRDGKFSLMNTNASRNGLLGAIGLDLEWTTGRLEFGGVEFTNIALRFKGNGTFLGAMGGVKKPLKIDLARQVPGRQWLGLTTLNFGNLSADLSCLSDTLAYEFFRVARVPAPRSTFGHVTLTVEGQWVNRPLGLYVMVENVDAAFARRWFGTDQMGLFKPVTYDLFADLGEDWSAYARIYDPKLPATKAHQQRVMGAARLVTRATEAEFAEAAPRWFDFEEIARFVAVNSLISSYDGFLNNGQNFYLYLDPKTDRFGLIPWDLDLAWGEFRLVGTLEEREQASIHRPWVADHRLLERLFAVPAFRELYRKKLEEIFAAQFVAERLAARVDALVPTVRGALVDESELRQSKFADAVTDQWGNEPGERVADMSPNRRAHQLKRFFVHRQAHVKAQLEGKEPGHEFLDRKTNPMR